jgi:hypothetical protein
MRAALIFFVLLGLACYPYVIPHTPCALPDCCAIAQWWSTTEHRSCIREDMFVLQVHTTSKANYNKLQNVAVWYLLTALLPPARRCILALLLLGTPCSCLCRSLAGLDLALLVAKDMATASREREKDLGAPQPGASMHFSLQGGRTLHRLARGGIHRHLLVRPPLQANQLWNPHGKTT